jgi:hypothetical protein
VTTQPTPEGLRRWPHTEGYHPDVSASDTQPDHDLPCTCVETCEPRCGGECGCKACEFAFVEFCDVAGVAPDVSEAEALERYRRG